MLVQLAIQYGDHFHSLKNKIVFQCFFQHDNTTQYLENVTVNFSHESTPVPYDQNPSFLEICRATVIPAGPCSV